MAAVRTLIECNGEIYLTASEVRRHFDLAWGTCQRNVLPHLQAYHLPGRRRTFYRLSEVGQFAEVRVERKSVEREPVVLRRSVS